MLTPAIRAQFPALKLRVHGHPLAYLDNASTTQKPQTVLEAIHDAYVLRCANVGRSVHHLSEQATEAYEAARDRLRGFVGAAASQEIVFTRGTTEAINLVAQAWGRANVGSGDRVVVSEMEHHSNLVPWQMLCREKGAELCMLGMDDRGVLDLDALDRLLDERTRVVAVTHVSNALGTVNDVAAITARAHAVGAVTVVDGAQAAAHLPIDVQALDCDFYALSGHKMYGPTGIGLLYGKQALLEAMPPWQGGGGMILTVTFAETTYAELPHRLEAGTPHIAGAIGLGAAAAWLQQTGLAAVADHEAALLERATAELAAQQDVRLIGSAPHKAPVVSFVMDGVHPHDVGTILDLEGIAVRTGHHCAQPVMDHFGVPATVRASFAAYNTPDEVDRLVAALSRVRETFR